MKVALGALISVVWLQNTCANSLGVGIPCNAENENLGNKGGEKDEARPMWWTEPPAFSGPELYTIKTTDTDEAGPTEYKPEQWMTIYIRTHKRDWQYTGLVMYAETESGDKVGDWEVPIGFRVGTECVTHLNADPKHYLTKFRFKPPGGNGKLTIKALLKFGRAFPTKEGNFYWPGDKFLELTEATPDEQQWFEGEVGESCDKVCGKHKMGCDLEGMKAVSGSPEELLKALAGASACQAPLYPGCSAHSPAIGTEGCFYHDPECRKPNYVPTAVTNFLLQNQEDPCKGFEDKGDVDVTTLSFPTDHSNNGPRLCVKNKDIGYCRDEGKGWSTKIASNPDAWTKFYCEPEGGYESFMRRLEETERPDRKHEEITCSAFKADEKDGRRLCKCSGNVVKTQAPTDMGEGTRPPTPALPAVEVIGKGADINYGGNSNNGDENTGNGNDGNNGDSNNGNDGNNGDSNNGNDGNNGDSNNGNDGNNGDSNNGNDGNNGDSNNGNDGNNEGSDKGEGGNDEGSNNGEGGNNGSGSEDKDGKDKTEKPDAISDQISDAYSFSAGMGLAGAIIVYAAMNTFGNNP